MEIKFLGHASWKIKTGGKTAYLDPYEGEIDEKADLILASHSHTDHCSPKKIELALKKDTKIIAPSDCADKIGTRIQNLKPGQKTTIGEVEVEAVEAYNIKRFRSPGVPFHSRGLGVSYLIRAEGKTIYHTGDTDYIPEHQNISNVDVMLVATGGTYTMDNDEAAELTLRIKPKVAIPMHIWDTDPSLYKTKVESRSKTKVIVLKPGEIYTL